MGRPLRIEFDGAVYHITSRGNARQNIFADVEDRKRFLKILRDYHARLHAVYHCLILMNNHYHLLLETPHGNLVSIMHGINSSYTGYFNRKYDRVGHLFQGRYKAIVVEKEQYLLELNRYIHLNPVRAGLCIRPEDYRWSSFRGYLYPRERFTWIEYDWTLEQFDENIKKAIAEYKMFVAEGNSKKVGFPLRHVVGGAIIGGKGFVDGLRPRLRERLIDREVVKRNELKGFVPSKTVMEAVAGFYGVSIERLIKRGKGNYPKKIALYLLHKNSGLSNKQITSLFNDIHYSAVSHAVRRLRNELVKNDSLARELECIEKLLGDLSLYKT